MSQFNHALKCAVTKIIHTLPQALNIMDVSCKHATMKSHCNNPLHEWDTWSNFRSWSGCGDEYQTRTNEEKETNLPGNSQQSNINPPKRKTWEIQPMNSVKSTPVKTSLPWKYILINTVGTILSRCGVGGLVSFQEHQSECVGAFREQGLAGM